MNRKYLPGWPRDKPLADNELQTEVKSPRYTACLQPMISGPSTTWGQHKVMLLTYLHTAAGCGELFELTWDDVFFDNQRIRLWIRKRKGGRECEWIPMTRDWRK